MSVERQGSDRQDHQAGTGRHNRALVSLAGRVWEEGSTLQDAFAAICATAADALQVERVNIWRHDPADGSLSCLHHYQRSSGRHNPPGWEARLRPGADYGALLGQARAVDYAGAPAADPALAAYLHDHGIGAMLDAPVRIAGELAGVVCHEHVGPARAWTAAERAFAGSIADFVAMACEIDRRRQLEGRLRYLELHDPHTGLPNRDHLLEVVRSALRPMHGEEAGLAAIHLQIDVSQHEGDADHALLARVAARLRGELAGEATLARVRGDAFAVLPHRHLHEAQARDLGGRCTALIEETLAAEGVPALVAAGIAFSRDLAAPSADHLLRNAETASRRARGGRCGVFDVEQQRGLAARLRTERELRDAFAEKRMRVHFQPEVDLNDGRWYAAEALLRWVDGQGATHSACEFIDTAEASGQIVPLGRWVLSEACRIACGWPSVGGVAPGLRVNVSARQFEQAGLVADVAAILADTGLPPQRLCLELTETALLSDVDVAARTLARLRELGLTIALDDFGVGYSSLAYLKRLPVDALKLDRSFVAGLPHDPYDVAIVEAITGLAHRTGIDIIAEGVETEAQARMLRGLGISRAQGFLYAASCDAEALLAGFAAAR